VTLKNALTGSFGQQGRKREEREKTAGKKKKKVERVLSSKWTQGEWRFALHKEHGRYCWGVPKETSLPKEFAEEKKI